MAVETKRTSVVLAALQVTLRRLADIPDSPEAHTIRSAIAECEQQAKEWKTSPATAQQREALMKRVLGLHLAITKLRHAHGLTL